MVVFKREKKKSRGKWISTGLFGVASISLCNRDEMVGHLCRHGLEIQKKSMCVCFFNVKPDAVQKDYIMYVW